MNQEHPIVGMTIANVVDERFGTLVLVMTDGSRWRVTFDTNEQVSIEELDDKDKSVEVAEMWARTQRVIADAGQGL